MSAIELPAVLDELRLHESFLITSHVNPDGDAIGSMLALGHLLKDLEKPAVTMTSNDPVPKIYSWLPSAGDIVSPEAVSGAFDLAVIIDVGQRDRIGKVAEKLEDGQRTLVIDHHLEESPCGTVNFVDPTYAAAAEIVAELYAEAGLPLSKDAAECIYVGLTTDTGGFRFANTNPRSHRIAASLLEAGVQVAPISDHMFETMSRPKFDLLKTALGRMEIGEDGSYAVSYITKEDMKAASAKAEDLDGIVNFARNIDGVEVGILFRELDSAKVKVSLRSKGTFNSAAVLKEFGGGGHRGAAGATLDLPFEEARDAILKSVRAKLTKANA